jgi:hypothetical protein
MPRVLHHCKGCSRYGCELIRPEKVRHRRVRKKDEQGRKLDKPSATGHRINKTGKKGKSTQEGNFYHKNDGEIVLSYFSFRAPWLIAA